MFLKEWSNLPEYMKNDYVKEYYNILQKKRISILAQRIFDLTFSIILLITLLPIFIIISIAIKIETKGPIIFHQVRVTQYGKFFNIYKFRTMKVMEGDKGSQITIKNDKRVTRIGKILRKYRLDELPQLINIFIGDMTFVGSRPEVVKYFEKYTEEMAATLLLPAGVTSYASIQYKDEELLLLDTDNIEKTYIDIILPEKMKLNLTGIRSYSFIYNIKVTFQTVFAVCKRNK